MSTQITTQITTQETIQRLKTYIATRIVGQEALIDRLLIALLADGHLLVEGAPGLAKTRAIKVLYDAIEADFHRIQFTPDLLPADLTGTEIFRQQTGDFHFQQGPLFHNLVLADEINRAPAKVQSALLEAMAERQITVGKVTYKLPALFMVMATQNSIEHEGTYPLPEAQLDRFLMHIRIDYPNKEAEREILQLARREAHVDFEKNQKQPEQVPSATLFAARDQVLDIFMAETLEEYIVELVLATRNPERFGDELKSIVEYGASPRATIALDRCARAKAWLAGRDFVTPEDVQELAFDVLRHRVMISYEAEASGWSVERFISELIARIPVP